MELIQGDCLKELKNIRNDSIDFILTDIPYDVVSRSSNRIKEFR